MELFKEDIEKLVKETLTIEEQRELSVKLHKQTLKDLNKLRFEFSLIYPNKMALLDYIVTTPYDKIGIPKENSMMITKFQNNSHSPIHNNAIATHNSVNLIEFALKIKYELPEDFWIFWDNFYKGNMSFKFQLIADLGQETFSQYNEKLTELQYLSTRSHLWNSKKESDNNSDTTSRIAYNKYRELNNAGLIDKSNKFVGVNEDGTIIYGETLASVLKQIKNNAYCCATNGNHIIMSGYI